MYDPALTVGRIGYEVQYRLAVDPRVLVFDPGSKKLGTRFDPRAWAPLAEMPPRWGWAADPASATLYLPDATPLTPRQRKWVLTDHHERFSDSIGYQSYRVWPDNPRVVCQLELVSKPLERSYSELDFQRDLKRIVEDGLRELVEVGVVGELPVGEAPRQQPIVEQINLELDDGSGAIAPTRKLICLALGLWALTRWRGELDIGPDHQRFLMEHFAGEIESNAPLTARYDLVTNVYRLLEHWLARGKQTGGLTWPFLRRVLTAPAWVTVLTQNLDNRFCSFYVHGIVRLDADAWRVLDWKDFGRLRKAGVDALFPDVWGGREEPHLTEDLAARYRVDFLRSGLRHFCHLAEIEAFVDAAISKDGTGPPGVEQVGMPLFHLRKTLAPGRVYLELRCVDTIRQQRHPRYPYQYRTVQWARKKAVRVHDCGHLHRLGTDCAWLFEVAMSLGALVLDMVETDDERLTRRKTDDLGARVVEAGNYLFRNFERPWWTPGYDGGDSMGMGTGI